MSELVSVIVPVYNVEKYLPECIDSIVNQKYTNLEILLIDDGSTDNSGKICDEWVQKDGRIRVIHKENKGVSEARNTGIKECKGQLIGFVDADDWVEPEMYSILVDKLAESGADIVMCSFYLYLPGQKNPIAKGLLNAESSDYDETVYWLIKKNGYIPSLWNKIFRREVVFQNNQTILMDRNLSCGEDAIWLYKALKRSQKTVCIPQVLYHYRSREDSITKRKTLTKEVMSLLDSAEQTLKFLPSSAKVQCIVKGSIYNSVYELKIIAYITKDKHNYHMIQEYLHRFHTDWIKSKEIKAIRKIKLVFLELCMKTRMPTRIVEFINGIR